MANVKHRRKHDTESDRVKVWFGDQTPETQLRVLHELAKMYEPRAEALLEERRPYSALLECNLDPNIEPLILALNSDVTVTVASCSGHDGDDKAYVALYIRVDMLAAFVDRMNRLHHAKRYRLAQTLKLNWNYEIIDSFQQPKDDLFPGWIPFLYALEQSRGGTPTSKQLRTAARVFSVLPGSGRPLRVAHKMGGGWIGVDIEAYHA